MAFSINNSGQTFLHQLAENITSTLGGSPSLEGSLRHCKTKESRNLSLLSPEELGHYDYYALYGFGPHSEDISKEDQDLMRSSLPELGNDKCLIIHDTVLDNTASNAHIRSFYQSYSKRPTDRAYVSVVTVRSGVNNQLLHRPAYHKLYHEKHTNWTEAFSEALKRMRTSMFQISLDDYDLPEPPSAKKNLVCPNGSIIRELRKNKTVLEGPNFILKIKTSDNPYDYSLSKTTQLKAEKGEPVSLSTISRIARVLKSSQKDMVFEYVAPNRKKLRILREAAFGGKEKQLGQLGSIPPAFFDLLEESGVVKADTMRTVHHLYGRVCGPLTGKFSDIINLSKTESLM